MKIIECEVMYLDKKIQEITEPGLYHIKIIDPEHIILGNPDMKGTFGYIFKKNIKDDILYSLYNFTDLSKAKVVNQTNFFSGCTNILKYKLEK